MQTTLRRISNIPVYFKLTFILIVLLLFFSLTHTKAEGFVLLNFYHRQWLDPVFRYCTILGEGAVFLILIALLVLLKQRKQSTTLAVAFLSSGLISAVLKRAFNQPRPKLYFQEIALKYPYFLNDTDTHSACSFPSGHTTAVFTIATVLVLAYRKKKLCIPLFVVAVLTGYSRIYLTQHFQYDVLAGICLGVFCGVLSYYLICNNILIPLRGHKESILNRRLHPD